jgi:hypothetical protein
MNDYLSFIVISILVLLGNVHSTMLFAQTEDPHKTGNVPITFYGKVIDQNNQPVPDVRVEVRILEGYEKSPGEYKQKVDNTSLVTDVGGQFVLDNVNGSYIEFNSIAKDGYQLSPRQTKANYLYYPSKFHPDVNNPVVFKMWKQTGAEPLAHSAWQGNVTPDGTLMAFDLLDGKKAKDGNLQITCTRVPLDILPREHKRYDYSFRIDVLGGGVLPTEDEFTYLAPEGGYVPSITIGAKADDPKWIGNVKQEFYIRTADGHYGRLSVDWYADLTSPTHFEWDCSINPSGSRNLER